MPTPRLSAVPILVSSLFLIASTGLAGTLVDPGGLVESLVADPVRDVFYATLETDEIVTVTTAGGIPNREAVVNDPGALVVAQDGSKLFVTLATSEKVAEYNLPGVSFSREFTLSDTQSPRPALATKPGRLYATRKDGLSIVDLSTGTEIYYGDPLPLALWDYVQILRLSPDGNRLYAMDSGLSPSSIFVLDVSTDNPTYIGEDCCHGCMGGNGQGMELSPDGSLAYVVVGGRYHLQVLNTEPFLHDKFAGPTGPYPNAVAPSADGSRVYVGYADPEFAVVRTSDWLPYHVGELQGDVVARGLVLASNQQVLAAVIEYDSFDPDRIELVGVVSPLANRGGIRVRPLDNIEMVPIANAYIRDPSQGTSVFVDMGSGYLGRGPIEPDNYDIEISSSGHTWESRNVTVGAGAWTDLGDMVMTRTGDMPDPSEVCGSPATKIGRTVGVHITGRGFFPGAGLDVTTSDAKVTIESFAYRDWTTIDATVTVASDATPGDTSIKVTNPDGAYEWGDLLRIGPGPDFFEDGFESGDTSGWSSSVP